MKTVNGGRQQSHLQALHLAQQHGWQNYLLLEDDAVILKREKHIQVLNALLASLAKIPWQVMILGGEISQGTMLKSLPGLVQCAGLPQSVRLSGEQPLLPAAGAADEQR